MLIKVQAANANLSVEDLKASLPPEAFKQIEGKKAVAYVIAEEGVSHPRVIGEGQQKLTWPKAVIKQIADSTKAGLKFFNRHNDDNSTEGRKSLGDVVGSFTRTVGNKLQAIAVGLLAAEDSELDVCSIEADVKINQDVVDAITSLTGIALSSSKVDNPAFPGAKRLALLQCFDSAEGSSQKPREGKMATFKEVKEFIEENNVWPAQLFSLTKLQQDREFGPLLAKGEAAATELAALKPKVETLEKANKDILRNNEVLAAKDLFVKLIPEGTTDKQKAFYTKRFDATRLEKLDEAALKEYLKKETNEFAEYAKLLGEGAGGEGEKQQEGDKQKTAGKTADPVDAALKELTGGK